MNTVLMKLEVGIYNVYYTYYYYYYYLISLSLSTNASINIIIVVQYAVSTKHLMT